MLETKVAINIFHITQKWKNRKPAVNENIKYFELCDWLLHLSNILMSYELSVKCT